MKMEEALRLLHSQLHAKVVIIISATKTNESYTQI